MKGLVFLERSHFSERTNLFFYICSTSNQARQLSICMKKFFQCRGKVPWTFRRWAISVLSNAGIIYLYTRLSEWFLYDNPTLHGKEWLILGALFFALHGMTGRRSDFFLPGLAVVVLMGAYDLEIDIHGVTPTVSTITLLPNTKDILGIWYYIAAILSGVLIFGFLWWWMCGWWYNIQAIRRVRAAFLALELRLMGILAWVLLMGYEPMYHNFLVEDYRFAEWNNREETEYNGRFRAFLVHDWRHRLSGRRLRSYQYPFDRPPDAMLFPCTPKERPNIYCIQLESFVDPRFWDGYRFSRSPIHPALRRHLQADTLCAVISPEYGGYSCQTTFEMLTGTPALQRISAVEFVTLDGYPTYSLPRHLEKFGYHTAFFSADRSFYYNSRMAYRSLGFDTLVYLLEIPKYYKMFRLSGKTAPDDSLYAFVLRHLDRIPKPHFVYMVTMYGHWPPRMNAAMGPDSVEVSPEQDIIRLYANYMYYRTRALGRFIDAILQRDSNAVVLAFADHLPPHSATHVQGYRYDRFHVPAFLLYKGRSVDISELPMHEIPVVLYHLLCGDSTDGRPKFDGATKEYLYWEVLRKARNY